VPVCRSYYLAIDIIFPAATNFFSGLPATSEIKQFAADVAHGCSKAAYLITKNRQQKTDK